MTADRADIGIVGAGILGLATALRLLQAHPDLRIALLEKEPDVARHQTGHNSGVVHAGLYYAPGSLKARLCREGKRDLEAYCDEHAIPLERTGKLVVALDESELPALAAIRERATANEVPGVEEVGPERIPRDRAPRGRHPSPLEPFDGHRRLPGGRARVCRRHPRAGRDDRYVASCDRHRSERRRARSFGRRRATSSPVGSSCALGSSPIGSRR